VSYAIPTVHSQNDDTKTTNLMKNTVVNRTRPTHTNTDNWCKCSASEWV